MNVFHNHVHLLKQQILAIARIENLSLESCVELKQSILEKTGHSLNHVVLERLFNLRDSKFPPSQFSLDILSIYCGYLNWEDFVHQEKR